MKPAPISWKTSDPSRIGEVETLDGRGRHELLEISAIEGERQDFRRNLHYQVAKNSPI